MKISLSQIIHTRLRGGRLYEEFKRVLPIEKNYVNDQLKEALCKKKKYISLEYFFTQYVSKKAKDDFMFNLWDTICRLYTDNVDSDRFNFNGAIIPKPTDKQSQWMIAREICDFPIYYLLDDLEFCDAVTIEGPYELGNVSIAKEDILIDCGANIGLFSAIASRKCSDVYAFEPSKHVINTYLSKTATWNPNINVCEYALSDKKEVLKFIDSTEHMAAGSIDRSALKGGGGQLCKLYPSMSLHMKTI